MKIKLTPELAYIIGFWRKRRAYEGLGVRGLKEHIELFSKEVLDRQLTTSDKLLIDDKKIYFYHTAYRKFFQDIENEQLERFKYLNEYAASYLAGLFDSVGGIDEKGFVFVDKANPADEILLMRLGFGARWRDGKLIIERPKAFLTFVKNYVKLLAGHEVFGLIAGKKKKTNTKNLPHEPNLQVQTIS
ncbi:hypothetical protein J4450_01360 [Candidatus Micrarchaeota archaeon]|nr:hypothetical protein [Candidatus Micrarchaeota archaeon]